MNSLDPALPAIRVTVQELAGAVGDFGTIIPLVVGVAIVSGFNAGYILLFFGLWFIITGLYYRLPIPIEPMKAIAVVAIAEGLALGQVVAAGLFLGILFLFLGTGKWMEKLERWIPPAVIRGIQLGLALLLFRTSGDYLISDLLFFLIGIAIVIGFLIASKYRGIPDLSSLVVLVLAISVGIALNGIPQLELLPMPQLIIPTIPDLTFALTVLVLPQALLTITNAILATSFLAKDLFNQEVEPKKLSWTIGLMTLTSIPFGGFPMCHGAGGLAGQYRYGARTGGANILAGVIFLIIAVFFGSPGFLGIIPEGFFGALLVFVGIELALVSLKTDSRLVTGTVGIVALVSSMTVAFVVGMVIAYIVPRFQARGSKKDVG